MIIGSMSIITLAIIIVERSTNGKNTIPRKKPGPK
jgi:hypothetical protein